MIRCEALRTERHDGGFTLIELVVVLGIVALGLAIAVPSLARSRQDLALRSTAYELATHFRAARIAAQTSNVERSMTVDVARRRYWGADASSSCPLHVAAEVQVPDSERMDASASRIRFFPDGGTSGAKIVLRDDRGSATVYVDWLSGDIRVHMKP